MNPIVFYDGECGFCNHWVQWILDRDRERIFRFAALQSPFSKELFAAFGKEFTMQSLVVLKEDGGFINRSRAVVYLFSRLNTRRLKSRTFFYWLLKKTPRFIADIGYSGVAVVRKVLQRNKCRLFTPEERVFFLNDADFVEWSLDNFH